MIASSSSSSLSGAWCVGTSVEWRRRNPRMMIRNRNSWFVVLWLLVVFIIMVLTGCGLLDVVGQEPYRSIRTTTIPTSLWPPAASSLPSTTARHVAGDLYIPTLSYRFRPTTTIPDATTMTPPECFSNARQRREVQWELLDDSNQTIIAYTSGPTPPPPPQKQQQRQQQQKRRLLIAITSGYDKYATMLTHTAHVAKLYASRINQQRNRAVTVSVVVLQGMAFDPHRDASALSSLSSSCTPPPMQTTLNKIRLLFYAIDHARTSYDQLLLLDADALLVNWDFDISQLLILPDYNDTVAPPLVVAQPCRFQRGRTRREEGANASIPQQEPYKVNTGITLWNLYHPYIKPVAMAWFEESKNAALKGIYQGDQRYLQMALSSHGRGEVAVVTAGDTTTTRTTFNDKPIGIQHTTHEFNYRDGTVIQHFLPQQQQRATRDTWKDRVDQLIQAYQHLCAQYDCSQVPRKDYPTE